MKRNIIIKKRDIYACLLTLMTETFVVVFVFCYFGLLRESFCL